MAASFSFSISINRYTPLLQVDLHYGSFPAKLEKGSHLCKRGRASAFCNAICISRQSCFQAAIDIDKINEYEADRNNPLEQRNFLKMSPRLRSQSPDIFPCLSDR
jgi:hypothetical protein